MNCDICTEICTESAATDDLLCNRCYHLLRWFRGYLDCADESDISPETTFVDLGVDSLDYVDWLAEAEKTLGIALTDAESGKIGTVREFIASLRKQGADWPADKSIRLFKRGRWCVSYDWDVVTEPDS